MIDLPIKFDQLVKLPGGAGGTGYPYRISAKDLMANFEYAALDADDSWIESTGGYTGQGRKLKLPAVPSDGETQNLSSVGGSISWTPALPALPASGTYVLGCVDGTLQWIETEEC